MCDFQTIAMITDRPAAVKAMVLKVTDCKHTAGLIYVMNIFYNQVLLIVVAVLVTQQLQQ